MPAPAEALPSDVLLVMASFLSDLSADHADALAALGHALPFPPAARASAPLGGARVSAAACAAYLRPVCHAWRAAADDASSGTFATLSARALGSRSPRAFFSALGAGAPRFVTQSVSALALHEVHPLPTAGADLASVLQRAAADCTGGGGLASIELRGCPSAAVQWQALGPTAAQLTAGLVACLALPHVAARLRSLALVHLAPIGDASLLLRPPLLLPRLESLDLSGCGRLCTPTGTNSDGTVAIKRDSVSNSGGEGSIVADAESDAVTDAGLLSFLGLSVGVAPALSSRCFATLATLRLSGCHFVTDAGISAALTGCPRLSELDVSRCLLLDGSFLRVLCAPPVAQRMVRLGLSGVGGAASAASACHENAAAALAAAAPSCFAARLRDLDLGWCLWLDDDALTSLGAALGGAGQPYSQGLGQGLRRLSLHACTAVTGAGLRALAASLPAPRLARLEALDLGQLPAASDEDLAAFISGCGSGSGGCVAASGVARRGRFVSAFASGFAPASSSSAPVLAPPLIVSGPRLPSLEELDISSSRTSDLTLAAIGAHCPRLRSLRCRVAVRVGATGLRALFSAARDAAEDARRRELLRDAARGFAPPENPSFAEVRGRSGGEFGGDEYAEGEGEGEGDGDSSHIFGLDSTGDQGTALVGADDAGSDAGSALSRPLLGSGAGHSSASARGTPDRRGPSSPAAAWRSSASAAVTAALAHAARPPASAAGPAPPPAFSLTLVDLDLWRSLEVGDEALRLIAQHCPLLRRLDLEGCDVALTDVGVAAVAAGCRRLVQLSLAGCATSDGSLRALARGCGRLEALDLSGGAEYTRAGLTGLVERLPRLHTLRLRRCAGVCDGFLRTLVRACPRLHALVLRSCGQKEGETDFVGITNLGPSGFWREGAAGPPTPREAEPAEPEASEQEERLTARCLDILAAATRAPAGRLAALDVAFVPAITVAALYRFLSGACSRADSSLTWLRAHDGVGTPQLTMLARRLALDCREPLPPGAAGPPAASSPQSTAVAVLEDEPPPMPPLPPPLQQPQPGGPAAFPVAAAAGQGQLGLGQGVPRLHPRELALRRLRYSVSGLEILS